ncbi:hypothetical protein ACRAR1_26880 [Streptomyces sanyensis]|uniref:hypothetical protein n=1 Tax=Streptomyces sanyensis TaxID=568869 RepID=UPI003D77A828
MLDAHESFQHVAGDDTWIYWGAYIGTPDEILVSGRLSDVADEIRRVRAEAGRRHGWITGTYLLRPLDGGSDGSGLRGGDTGPGRSRCGAPRARRAGSAAARPGPAPTKGG